MLAFFNMKNDLANAFQLTLLSYVKIYPSDVPISKSLVAVNLFLTI